MGIVQSHIQVSDLFYNITSNQQNLDLRAEIGDTLYNANYRKRVIIPNIVTIGSLSTAEAALKIPSGAGGEIVIENYGSIQGAGGPAGNNGGDAILAQSNCRINNKSGGTIYAGGGGGGVGGTGGQGGGGSYTYSFTVPGVPVGCPPAPGLCNPGIYPPQTRYATAYTSGGAGGSGGTGGKGRGYDGALTSGSGGTAGSNGGTNAGKGGTGGTGGSGGNWGTPGATGNTGNTGANGNYTSGLVGATGTAGGSAGLYINGLNTYATLNNQGTVLGET